MQYEETYVLIDFGKMQTGAIMTKCKNFCNSAQEKFFSE